MWSNCPKGRQEKNLALQTGSTACPHLVVTINTELAVRGKAVLTVCQLGNPSVIFMSIQNGNKYFQCQFPYKEVVEYEFEGDGGK